MTTPGLLLDANLSPRLHVLLQEAGYDTVHVYDLQLNAAEDAEILEVARSDGRVLVTADTDFGRILALTGAGEPSVVLVRSIQHGHPIDQCEISKEQLVNLADELAAGAIAALSDRATRLTQLPIHRHQAEP